MATCPIHGKRLKHTKTRFGGRWGCPVEGCTVVWWGSRNATPADKPLRDARMAAHTAFDKLWKGCTKLMERGQAYEWLQQTFDLPAEKAHIGLFTKEQCERLAREVRDFLRGKISQQQFALSESSQDYIADHIGPEDDCY